MIPERLLNIEDKNGDINEVVGEAAWILDEQWLEAKRNGQELFFYL